MHVQVYTTLRVIQMCEQSMYGNFAIDWSSFEGDTDDSDVELIKASQKIESEYLGVDTDDSDVAILEASQKIEMEYFGAIYSDISDDEKVKSEQNKDLEQIAENKVSNHCPVVSGCETLSENKEIDEKRFIKVSREQLNDLAFSRLPPNTISKSKWAVRAFEKWRDYRRTMSDCVKIVERDLLSMDKKELNECLSYFIAEIRKQDGSEYRGKTLYELITATQYHLRMNRVVVNFLQDDDFIGLRNVLDGKMKEISRNGIGLDKKQADIITEENEEILWKTGILGSDTPKKLLDTVFYLIGLNFALRAGKEHRNLRCGENSQITMHTANSGMKYLQYTEDVSKTNQGGLKHLKHTRKCVKAFENKNNPERCIVRLYEKYLNLRPAKCSCDALYLQPSKVFTTNVWFNRVPLGVHTLQGLVKDMCARAKLKGYFTNHSLRATAATRLYNAGLDEQLIAETTGHSSDAVRAYKRTSEAQLENISEIIQNKRIKEEHIAENTISSVEDSEKSGVRELSIENEHFKLYFKF